MKSFIPALLTLALLLGSGAAFADEATRQKLREPRFAEAIPKTTLKLAAEARSTRNVQAAPDYPVIQLVPAASPKWPYWLAAGFVPVLGVGLYAINRRKGRSRG